MGEEISLWRLHLLRSNIENLSLIMDEGESTPKFGDGDEILFSPCIETALLYIFIYNFTQNV
jgi:hypothetical protein